jgi:phosphate transport system substrate-binding protein
MHALLQDLNSLPGVVGSMFCDDRQGVLARAFPPDYPEADLNDIATAVSGSTRDLRGVTGAIGVLDLRYRDARVVVRPVGDAQLLVLCDKSADAKEVLAFAAVACKKFERLQHPVLAGPASGHFPAAAAPPRPATPAAEAPPPRVPFEESEALRRARGRRTGLAAGVALVAVAVAAFFFLPVGKGDAPAPTARREAEPAAASSAPAPASASTAPAAAAAAEPTPAVLAAAKPLLRISGADALAAELVPALAQAYLSSLRVTDPRIHRDGEQVTVGGMRDGQAVTITVSPGATSRGLEELLGATADGAVATRRVRGDEREKLTPLGSMTSPANEHVLGLGGVAVVVNKANPVAALNREQLAQILGGASSDWSSFGVASDEEWSAVGVAGKGGPVASGIHVYLPDDRSGIPEAVQSLILGKRSFAPEAKRFASFQAVADAVIADPGGLGVVPFTAVAATRTVPVSDLDDPALIPTAFTVSSEDYFLTHRLYLYTAQASPNPNVARFVDFALGPEGQVAVKKAGFVELAVKAERRSAPAGAPADYVRLTAGARRLSSTFRFEVNASTFDNRAQVDLDRVTEYLREQDLNGAAVRVLGFADAQGSAKRNQQLALDRATLVAQAFAQRGITGVTLAGFGAALPVADNGSDAGRLRNRRVEIWVATSR